MNIPIEVYWIIIAVGLYGTWLVWGDTLVGMHKAFKRWLHG